MNSSRFPLRLLPFGVVLAFPLCSPADVLRWDFDGTFPPPPEDPLFGQIIDGSGTWDTTGTSWTSDAGATNIAWSNPAAGGVAHDAEFGNGGDLSPTVSVAGTVQVKNITFRPMAPQPEFFPEQFYTIAGGILDLRAAAPLSVITVEKEAKFNNQLRGGGFTKNGTGMLTLGAGSGNLFPTTSGVAPGAAEPVFEINGGLVELNGGNNKNHFGIGLIHIKSGAELRLANANHIGDDRSVVRIDEGGKFNLNGQSATISGYSTPIAEKFGYLDGSGELLTGGSAFVLHMGGGAQTCSYSGVIGGAGNIWIDAANIKSYSTQELRGANTFTGRLFVYAGTLSFDNIAALGASVDPTIELGTAKSGDNPVHGILRYTGSEPLVFTHPLHLGAIGSLGTNLGGGGIESSGSDPAAAVTVSSTITSALGQKTFLLGGSNTGANSFASILADAGDAGAGTRQPIGLHKTGAGTWSLSAANSFTGGVEVSGGVLSLEADGAINSTPGEENSLRLGGGTVKLNGRSLILGNGTAAGWGLAGSGGSIQNNAANPVTLTVRQGSTQPFRGVITDAGSGTLSLIKEGPGSLVITGAAQAYQGSTTVSAGTLQLQRAAAALPVSGAAWHLDASDDTTVTTNAGVVTEWRDKTANRRHVSVPILRQPALTSTPTYETAVQNGRNAVRFDGISDMLALNTVAGFAADAGTIFVVCSNAANGDSTVRGGGLIGGNGLNGTTAQRGIRGPRGGVWYGSGENTDFSQPNGSEFRINGALTTTVTPAGGSYWHTLTATRQGTAMKINSIGGFSTLSTAGTDEFWFRGDIGEVIVYPTVLTPEQRSAVEAYLQQKWFTPLPSSNLLPVTTAVTVAAGATLDCGVPQTVASLDLGGAFKTGAPAGELIVSGSATLQNSATLFWDVTSWTGAAGTGYDVLTADTLNIAATAETPVTVKIAQSALTGFAPGTRTFTLARATTALSGFNPAKFVLDSTGFTAGPGTWSIQQSGNTIELKYEQAATPFDLWIAAFGLSPADSLPAADPDGDGWANICEFAVNGHPSNRSVNAAVSEKITGVSGANVFTITVPVRSGLTFSGAAALSGSVDGVTYTIEGSDALAAWTLDIDEVTPAVSAGLPVLPAGWEYRSFRSPGAVEADAADFLRVRVQAP